MILGTAKIGHILNVIREKGDRCPGNPLGQCPSSLPFASSMATATVEDNKVATRVLDPLNMMK